MQTLVLSPILLICFVFVNEFSFVHLYIVIPNGVDRMSDVAEQNEKIKRKEENFVKSVL